MTQADIRPMANLRFRRPRMDPHLLVAMDATRPLTVRVLAVQEHPQFVHGTARVAPTRPQRLLEAVADRYHLRADIAALAAGQQVTRLPGGGRRRTANPSIRGRGGVR